MSQYLLLAEDSHDDELLSLRAIRESGISCKAVIVRNGGDAMDLVLSSTESSPDLIVLDFHLPEYNGLEILRELRRQERTKYVPVVILSSLESLREVQDCLAEGANSCVRKPIDPYVYIDHVAMIVKYWLTVNRNDD